MSHLIHQILRNWFPEWTCPSFILSAWLWLQTTFVYKIFSFFYFYGFIYPFARLYLQGPWLWGWGFWNGMLAAEICSRMNGAVGPTSAHYAQFPEICHEMIERDLNSKLVFIETIIFLPLLLYGIIKLTISMCSKTRIK